MELNGAVQEIAEEHIIQNRRCYSAGRFTNSPFDALKVLPANSINKTLLQFDLEIVEGKGSEKHNKAIDISIPKIVCLTPYSIADEEKPKPRVGDAESVLTHIRNSFAHGNTYFFDNEITYSLQMLRVSQSVT